MWPDLWEYCQDIQCASALILILISACSGIISNITHCDPVQESEGLPGKQDWAAPRKLLSVPRCPLAVPPSGFGSIGPQLQILCDESLQHSLVCEALLIITTAAWASTSSWGRPSTTSTSTRTSSTLTTAAQTNGRQTTYFR